MNKGIKGERKLEKKIINEWKNKRIKDKKWTEEEKDKNVKEWKDKRLNERIKNERMKR